MAGLRTFSVLRLPLLPLPRQWPNPCLRNRQHHRAAKAVVAQRDAVKAAQAVADEVAATEPAVMNATTAVIAAPVKTAHPVVTSATTCPRARRRKVWRVKAVRTQAAHRAMKGVLPVRTATNVAESEQSAVAQKVSSTAMTDLATVRSTAKANNARMAVASATNVAENVAHRVTPKTLHQSSIDQSRPRKA